MSMQNAQKSEITSNHQYFQQSSSKCKFNNEVTMARGAGFEPARPLLTTGLAGLPPTRLGQPRLFFLIW